MLVEVKGKAEKVAVVPADFPTKTLVTGTCFKLTTNKTYQRSLLVAYLTGKYGALLKNRLKTNLLVSYIAKDDLFRIPVPKFKHALNLRLHQCVEASLVTRNRVLEKLKKADDTLLVALGLTDWTPPEPLSYTARASAAFAAGRMDARFFAPRIQALLDIIRRGGGVIGDVATPRRQKFQPSASERFHYIEIGDIDGTGAAKSVQLACADAPSRATWHVKPDDIITSTVRPIRRLSAKVAPEQDGHVCSSGFVVIEPHGISPDVLLTYLRLPVICELLDLYASASMYPAIDDAHIYSLPIPETDVTTEAGIVKDMRDARTAAMDSTRLLETAKRAVEIAIEEGEVAAMTFLGLAEGAS